MSFFADYLLFDNHAAFVFFGSKPLVSFILNPPMTEEEQQALFDRLPPALQKGVQFISPPYDLWHCWKTWAKYQPQNPNPKFVIFEIPLTAEPPSKKITVANMDRVLETLTLHYDQFKDTYGQEFNPHEKVEEISNPHSKFWKAQFSNHVSKGILFGYGKRNAEAFDEMISNNKKIENFNSTGEKISPYTSTKRKFTIPIFRTYEDEKIAKRVFENCFEREILEFFIPIFCGEWS